jgi:hypothetical protein
MRLRSAARRTSKISIDLSLESGSRLKDWWGMMVLIEFAQVQVFEAQSKT